MDAVLAGLTAWAIEISIAGTFLYLLIREEKKVILRRKQNAGSKRTD
jgi:hypothetical protein